MRCTRTLLLLVSLFFVASPVALAGPVEPPAKQAPAEARRGEPRPATPAERERYAEREKENTELEEFEGGRRGGGAIPVTTVIVVLLAVILIVLIV